jgi:hypothetical protein
VIWNILVALTQLLNTLLGGFPDETTSSRAHRQQDKLRWRITRRVINAVFFLERDHCEAAWFSEKKRRQLPPELR